MRTSEKMERRARWAGRLFLFGLVAGFGLIMYSGFRMGYLQMQLRECTEQLELIDSVLGRLEEP